MNECERLRRVSQGSIATATPKKQAFPIYPPGSYTNRVGCLAWRNVDNAEGASAGRAIKDDCCVADHDGLLLWGRCMGDAP